MRRIGTEGGVRFQGINERGCVYFTLPSRTLCRGGKILSDRGVLH
jgi:hypothetical protein